jgi:hypothetical protein
MTNDVTLASVMQPKIHTFEMYVLGGFGLIGVNWQIGFLLKSVVFYAGYVIVVRRVCCRIEEPFSQETVVMMM